MHPPIQCKTRRRSAAKLQRLAAGLALSITLAIGVWKAGRSSSHRNTPDAQDTLSTSLWASTAPSGLLWRNTTPGDDLALSPVEARLRSADPKPIGNGSDVSLIRTESRLYRAVQLFPKSEIIADSSAGPSGAAVANRIGAADQLLSAGFGAIRFTLSENSVPESPILPEEFGLCLPLDLNPGPSGSAGILVPIGRFMVDRDDPTNSNPSFARFGLVPLLSNAPFTPACHALSAEMVARTDGVPSNWGAAQAFPLPPAATVPRVPAPSSEGLGQKSNGFVPHEAPASVYPLAHTTGSPVTFIPSATIDSVAKVGAITVNYTATPSTNLPAPLTVSSATTTSAAMVSTSPSFVSNSPAPSLAPHPTPSPAAVPAVSAPSTSIVQASIGGVQGPASTDILFASNFGPSSPPPLLTIDPTGTVTTFNNTTNHNPQGVAFDSANNLYVAYADASSIEKFSLSGTDLGSYVTEVAGSGVRGIAFDSAGNLYVANENSNTIEKITPGGVASVFVDASKGLKQPNGLVFDSAGNLYVSNIGTGTISKISITNGTAASVSNSFVTGLSVPAGLAISGGNIYVANSGLFVTNGVQGFSLSTGVLAFSAVDRNQPIGLAFDSLGNLYAADSAKGNIIEFALTAGVLSPVSTTFATIGTGDQPQYLAFASIPEPASLGLLLLGGGLAVRRRRRPAKAIR